MENTYHLEDIPRYIPKLLKALPLTFQILWMSLVFSLLLGAIITVGTLSKNKAIQSICKGYISFMRGIPTLVLIFLLYLGLPQFLKNVGINLPNIPTITYIITCLSLSISANMAEMMRTSYLAVDKGQREAAYSVGMKDGMAFLRIIFPQALGVAIPMLGNNIIMLFKETSLAFTVGVIDLLGKARAISAASYGTNRLEVYLAAGLIFWAICFVLEKMTKIVEKAYTKGRKRATS